MTNASNRRLMQPADGARNDVALVAFVERCRRRAGLLLFGRYLAMVCTAVFLSSAAMLMIGVGHTYEFSAGAMAIALAGSALTAFRFAPTWSRVAAEIDRRIGLDDSVVAALQVRHSDLPVASLVVRDAFARIDPVTPAAVYPLDLRRQVIVAGSAALVLGLVAAFHGPSAISSMTSSASGPSSAVAGADGRNLAGQLQPAGAEALPGSARVSGTNQRPLTGDSGTNVQNDVQRQATGQPDSPAPTQVQDSNSGRDRRRAESSPPVQLATEPGTSAASGSARSGAAGRGGSGNGEGAAAGGTGASGIGQGAGAGGVRGQRADGATSQATGSASVRTRSDTEYGNARERASLAISRNQVPPDLRNYVRDYFIAIAPQTEGQ